MRLLEMATYEKLKQEILQINQQIDELAKRKHHLERLIAENFPSNEEENRLLIPTWNNQSKLFLERIQDCLETVEGIKTKVIENFTVKVTPYSYTQRGSDNYLVCWSNIESHSYWSDDEYLNLPKVKIALSSYREKDEEKWENPDYPSHEDRLRAAEELEVKYKKEIELYFDTQYNKYDHLKYLIEKCLKQFSETSSWDYQILKPIVKNNNLSEVAEILYALVPKNVHFAIKRLLMSLLIEKNKQ